MPNDTPLEPSSSTATPPPPGRRPRDFSDLSKVIIRRTTDLIVIGLIVLAGLTTARRVLNWWSADPQSVAARPHDEFPPEALAPWGGGPQGASVEFGDAPFSLQRQNVAGSLEDVRKQLVDNCRDLLADDASLAELPELSPSESQLLARLRPLDPVESGSDAAWSIYHLEGPLAMTVGVRDFEGAAENPRRIVCWGLAFPSGAGHWSVLTVRPKVTAKSDAQAPLPLPSGASRGIYLSDELGGSLLSFHAAGNAASLQSHFDRLSQKRQWERLRSWSSTRDSFSSAWIDTKRDQRIDLQLVRSREGWSGLLHVSPSAR